MIRYRPIEYQSEDGPWDPISGGASALLGTLGSLAMGFADFPVEIFKAMRPKPSESPKPGQTPQLLPKSNSLEALPTDLGNVRKASSSSTPTLPTSPGPPTPTEINLETVHELAKDLPHRDALGKNDIQDASLHRSGSSLSQSSEPDLFTPQLLSHRTSTDVSAHQIRRTTTGSQLGHIPLDAAVGAGKSLGHIVGTGLKSPMDFTLSLARGFHNAPKLYGDESVRQGEKITGFQSGLKAAGKVRRLLHGYFVQLLTHL